MNKFGFFVLAVLVCSAVDVEGQRRRVVRKRGRNRAASQRAIDNVSAIPNDNAASNCPEPEGLQVYDEPRFVNNIPKVY